MFAIIFEADTRRTLRAVPEIFLDKRTAEIRVEAMTRLNNGKIWIVELMLEGKQPHQRQPELFPNVIEGSFTRK